MKVKARDNSSDFSMMTKKTSDGKGLAYLLSPKTYENRDKEINDMAFSFNESAQ